MLHVTNGDHAVAVIRQVVQGAMLPWRDVLHEGPVRAGLPLEALSEERARFIADAGWGPFSQVRKDFAERDAALRRAGEHDEIVLWFEHDLYDQLQLIQVLDALAAQFEHRRGPPISLVCEAEYLGRMAPARAAELFALRNPLVRRHFQEAQAAWAAFRSPDPQGLENLRTTSLPFLAAAIRRHLEEFPWTTDGLSRTERQILQGNTQEEPQFMSDVVLKWHVERLEQGRRFPRWLGGYEVKDDRVRWDPASARLVRA